MIGSLGGAEILLILVVALLLFGPRKLPEIGRTIGRALGEFRRASTDFKSSLEQEVRVDELKQAKEEVDSVRRAVSDLTREVCEPVVARSASAATPEGARTATDQDKPAARGIEPEKIDAASEEQVPSTKPDDPAAR